MVFSLYEHILCSFSFELYQAPARNNPPKGIETVLGQDSHGFSYSQGRGPGGHIYF